MDTNRIKKFATEARTKLKAGIAAKIQSLGFDAYGNVDDRYKPEKIQGATIFNGQMYSEGFYNQWQSLYNRIKAIGLREVYEEAAYTWFNRLVAIRILQKNGIGSPVLEFVDAARTPQIVDDARMGRYPKMPAVELQSLRELILDDTKVTEQFAMLITAYCHDNPILSKCFGAIADYTELLIPNNILAEGGFIDLLNHTEFITSDDFKSPELIGWLYQFYISERKDEVFESFKKGKKAESTEEIAAATQIFTPNWIVKYMVQNTVGRIYLDNNPWEEDIKKDWKYLVEPSSSTPEDCKLKYNDLSELKVGDLACGSGHILNECFDLLFQLYINEGYNRSQAVESIFKNNLVGVDLDTRAKQLATFALLLKACQKDDSFADAHCMPRVLNMPTPYDVAEDGPISGYLHHFFQGTESRQMVEEIEECFDLMQNSDSLGSIMKFNISGSTRVTIKQTVEYWESQTFIPEDIQKHLPAFLLILTLTEKYSALVMNPPYMGAGNMNAVLSKYVKENYAEGKADLFSAFMILSVNRLMKAGKYGMINMQSWMFLSSFESLRRNILDKQVIDSLVHLGPHTFDELSGEVVQNVAFVITNIKSKFSNGIYFRLVKGRNCSEKEMLYINALTNHEDGFYNNVNQHNYERIPGFPFGYWVSEKVQSIFTENLSSDEVISLREGIHTGKNELFLRNWHEINKNKFVHIASSETDIDKLGKWVPYNKGGAPRKWYGNNDLVIRFDLRSREEMAALSGHVRPSQNLYFKEGATWSALSSGHFSLRYYPKGFLFDSKGQVAVGNKFWEILTAFNTNVYQMLADIIMPTLDYKCGDVKKLPYTSVNSEQIEIAKNNVEISKSDWNAHETSWDFQTNELVKFAYVKEGLIDDFINEYRTEWENNFDTLHENEVELNRQFIEIYGLQDELKPDVDLSDITILQAGEITHVKDENEYGGGHYVWNYDNLIKQLISYAVGVWMGRYRLDKPGLHIAYPNPSSEELATYQYKDNDVTIDDDAIIPILPKDSSFDDNLINRVTDFIRIAFGNEYLTQNLNFMEKCLGTTIENYLQKDFWKDHKKMYQNRPIYWLFSSKKGAFKCLTYMHRMDAYTAATVRNKYLLKYIDALRDQITSMEGNAAYLTAQQTRKLTNLRKDLEECLEYDERLQVYAEIPNEFDLDDGVVVNYAKFGDVLSKLK